MATSDWWSRRLSQATGQPPAPPPGSTAAPPTSPRAAPGYTSYDADGAQVADDGTMATLATAAAATGGSARVREDSGHCPECGSGNFFARRYTEQGMALRMEAAPRCFDCGYPVIQAGSSHGSASSVRPSGPARRARQLPSNHAVTVVADGGNMTFPPN